MENLKNEIAITTKITAEVVALLAVEFKTTEGEIIEAYKNGNVNVKNTVNKLVNQTRELLEKEING